MAVLRAAPPADPRPLPSGPIGASLHDVRVGDADVAIAGISMTAERETVIDFAHPYYDSGLQVVTRPSGDAGTWESLWGVITSGTVLALAGGLIVLIGVVAHLVWWTERRHNPEFPQEYRKGISEADARATIDTMLAALETT